MCNTPVAQDSRLISGRLVHIHYNLLYNKVHFLATKRYVRWSIFGFQRGNKILTLKKYRYSQTFCNCTLKSTHPPLFFVTVIRSFTEHACQALSSARPISLRFYYRSTEDPHTELSVFPNHLNTFIPLNIIYTLIIRTANNTFQKDYSI